MKKIWEWVKFTIFGIHDCSDFAIKTLHSGGAMWQMAGLGYFYHIECSKCGKMQYQECRPKKSCRNCISFIEGTWESGICERFAEMKCKKKRKAVEKLNIKGKCSLFKYGIGRLKELSVEIVEEPIGETIL